MEREDVQTSHILALIPVAYVVLQWSALTRMKAGWRRAAIVPAAVMAAALVFFAVGIAAQVGLARLALMLGLPLATLYLALLFPVYWLTARVR